ncbi:MAG: hypothetical protein ACI9TY_000521 [Alphaproteobacteria bacterium]|jgi:hypothetical protein
MRKFGFITLMVMFFVAATAEARSYSSSYKLYSYGGKNASSDYSSGSAGISSSRYGMYKFKKAGSHSKGSRSSRNSTHFNGRTSTQHYNDPTGSKIIYVGAEYLPMPSGNYGRASNRVRVSY